uniref:Cytochrome b n=1 Tax=Iberobaenia minuta TaxID=1857294 RepID=A0A3G1HJR7_9COLE|nr:cytochrome b [Iberobaenia minuta]
MMKKNKMIQLINNSLINLPTPSNISTWWNMGSILGMSMMIQTLTGIFLAMQFSSYSELTFFNLINSSRNINNMWIIRTIHTNGASLLFIFMYMHIGRSLYFGSYMNKNTWKSGIIMLMMMMMTAFLGYVLPWGQMSFWGATVITNLLSTMPYIGKEITQWMWGGFAVNNYTLTRFFTLHFLMPFIIMALMMIHLMFLHESGSNNPLGTNSNIDKIPFHPLFTFKDMLGFTLTLMLLSSMILLNPYLTMDSENFLPANPLSTPNHIKPEWYFLFAYAILRSIPNKLGGVLAMAMSMMMLFMVTLNKKQMQSNKFYPLNKIIFWTFLSTTIMLTWLGGQTIKFPYTEASKLMTIMYFMYMPMENLTTKLWDKMMKNF